MTDTALIEASVSVSGQTPRVFALYLIGRDKRTVERWRAGSSPIPPAARDWLERWLALRDRQRDTIIRLLVPESERSAA